MLGGVDQPKLLKMLMQKHRINDINQAERESMIISLAQTMKAGELRASCDSQRVMLDTQRSQFSNISSDNDPLSENVSPRRERDPLLDTDMSKKTPKAAKQGSKLLTLFKQGTVQYIRE
jgi:hypothetical protein